MITLPVRPAASSMSVQRNNYPTSSSPSIEDCLGLDELERRRTRRIGSPPTNPADWKAGLALQIEIFLFIVLVFGLDHCGLLTLIFQHRRNGPPVSPQHAQTLFKNAWRHLLPKFFVAYIAVMDFHRSGQIHLH